MRWSILDCKSSANVTMCSEAVSALQVTYPELTQGDYKVWKECLTKYILPACAEEEQES